MMCLDGLLVSSHRRMFQPQPHKATGLDGQVTMISCDNVSDHLRNLCNHCEEGQHSVDLQDVVLDANTFQQMLDEMKALKLTVLNLQRLLCEVCIQVVICYVNFSISLVLLMQISYYHI